jgi:hypothetical protein
VRRTLLLIACAAALSSAAPAAASESVEDRVDDLQQELDSLIEDVEDLHSPVAEFELFDQCAYHLGVSEQGTWDGPFGYVFGAGLRPALALDIRGFGRPSFEFLAFPAEEPPSIECNEDADG